MLFRSLFIGDTPPEAAAEPAVSLDSFLNFWNNPVRHWLRRALQWQRPYADRPADSAEPYAIERSDEVKQRYLDARRQREDFAQTEAKLQADSLLPAGLLGEILQEPEEYRQYANAEDFQRHQCAVLRKPILSDSFRMKPVEKPLDGVFWQRC